MSIELVIPSKWGTGVKGGLQVTLTLWHGVMSLAGKALGYGPLPLRPESRPQLWDNTGLLAYKDLQRIISL